MACVPQPDGGAVRVTHEHGMNHGEIVGFLTYTPPRPLEEIGAAIRDVEKDIVRMLGEVTGGRPDPAGV